MSIKNKIILITVIIVIIIFIPKLCSNDEAIILDVPLYNQHPNYPTGCESAALYMLLQYYDVDVTMESIVNALPKGPIPYEKNGKLYGANPEKEFVGNPKDKNSYGVYNKPIQITANKFKKDAQTKNNATIDDIQNILKNGNPVIAWYTTNIRKGIQYKKQWIDYETGETIKWPSYEHAIVIYGVKGPIFFYNDPNTGSSYVTSIKDFQKVFNELGGRIVYYNH